MLVVALGASGCQGDDEAPVVVAKGTVAPTLTKPPTATEPPPATPSATATDLPRATETVMAVAERLGVAVPRGRPATLDGRLSPGEWEGAAVEAFADGSELLLMYAEGSLYLAIRATGPEMVAGNVFVERGGEVAILHASAALGTALYEDGDGWWQQTKDFAWCCRSTGFSAAAEAEREAFWAEEGWQAANSRMGTPNELEYRIWWPGGEMRLAVNFLRTSEPDVKIPWPAELDDDVTLPTPGGLPTELALWTERWGWMEAAE
jgi:hypothetical protein